MLNGAGIIVSLFFCFVGGAYACCSEDDCPSGWIKSGCSCYLFDEGSRSWEGSKAFCESKGSSLVTVGCSKENDFIRQTLFAHSVKHYYWIGARWNEEHSDYRWIDGSPFNFIGWGPSKPDNNNGCLDYLNVGQVVWQWNDHWDCNNTNGPCICEMDCTVKF